MENQTEYEVPYVQLCPSPSMTCHTSNCVLLLDCDNQVWLVIRPENLPQDKFKVHLMCEQKVI